MNDGGVLSPYVSTRRPILVTGGAGFIGSNLADRLASEGHDVIILDALVRPGVEINLEWLKRTHGRRITAIVADIRSADAVNEALRDAAAVFHFASQVAVTTSLLDPVSDFDVNARATLLILDEIRRKSRTIPLLFASTNKVYGNLSDLPLRRVARQYQPDDPLLRQHGIGEDRRLDFHTPYGCSKGAADQYVLDYARSYGIPAVVMRMSCIYGPRQMGTEDQGWVAHFALKALADETITIYGDGCQVRDILDVSDAVEAYMRAWRRIGDVKGAAFNLGGGPANAVSLLQVIRHIERLAGRAAHLVFRDWRAGDQRYYVSDTRRIRSALGFGVSTPWLRGVANLVAWFDRERASGPRLVPEMPTDAAAVAS